MRLHPEVHLGRCTTIGDHTRINGPAHLASSTSAPIEIGRYCAIARNLHVRTRNHLTGYANLQVELQRRHGFPDIELADGPVRIGSNVWIGDNVTVLAGVEIADGAVIGAGAVVTRDIPPFAIAVGVPARVVRQRVPDAIATQLLRIRWWDWDEDRIGRNRALFELDLAAGGDVDLEALVVP